MNDTSTLFKLLITKWYISFVLLINNDYFFIKDNILTLNLSLNIKVKSWKKTLVRRNIHRTLKQASSLLAVRSFSCEWSSPHTLIFRTDDNCEYLGTPVQRFEPMRPMKTQLHSCCSRCDYSQTAPSPVDPQSVLPSHLADHESWSPHTAPPCRREKQHVRDKSWELEFLWSRHIIKHNAQW